MYQGLHLANALKIVRANALAETALAAAKYPASGAFVDVLGARWVTILVHLGTVHASDTPALQVQEATAINGTPASISGLLCEVAANDDGEFVVFHIDPTYMTDGYRYLTLDVSDVANGSFGDITYLLYMDQQPATQPATLPSASVFSLPATS